MCWLLIVVAGLNYMYVVQYDPTWVKLNSSSIFLLVLLFAALQQAWERIECLQINTLKEQAKLYHI